MYENDAYIMAFADEDGEIYNVHITDDLNSFGTWEYIDFKFTLPHSCYILIWRRDQKTFTRENAKEITKYIRDDLKDFISEGRLNESKWHDKIRKKLVNSNNCLVLAWDEMNLPEQYLDWQKFTEYSYEVAKDESKTILEPGSLHDRELAIYEGKINLENKDNPILKSFTARSNEYNGFKIPSDEVIKQYVTEMLLENYHEANVLLSKHYDIFPAIIDTEERIDDSFVGYDFVNHRISFDLTKLSKLELRIPALILGFFRHLSCVKDWVFSEDAYQSLISEKKEAEKFSYATIQRMLDIGIDPR